MIKKILNTALMLGVLGAFSTQTVYAARISGTVTFQGNVPKFREIKMDADPICLSKHTEKVYPETLVLGPNNGMGNVFVFISKGLPKKEWPTPEEPVVVTQKGCVYNPHVLGVMVGQPLKFLNPDGTLHNVHALSKINPEFNLAMPKFRKETTKYFEKAEFMFPVKCDVHPWMSSWVAVMPHPYFTVTKAEEGGTYSINRLEPGEYEVGAWHEKLGSKTATIKVSVTEKNIVNFVFSR